MRISGLMLTVAAFPCVVAGCGHSSSGGGTQQPPDPSPSGLATGPAECAGGSAAGFACDGISLRKRVAFAALGGSAGNDIWGWYDSTTGREYALVGMTTGTAFVDVSNPDDPLILGTLPTETVASGWRDIKVYRDHAYVVADNAADHGMQVFDLTRLRGVSTPQTFSADSLYDGIGNAHNVAINEATGFAYAVGTDTCNGGLHIIDLSVPKSPVFAGCHALHDTHDTQCVLYHGPDIEHVGREICFSSNEDHVEIVDVTDKASPVRVAMVDYPNVGFVHQGWLSEDHAFFFVGDELDELSFVIGTRTIVLDVSNLDAPVYSFSYDSPNAATDHNLYVRGNRIYEGNYSSGLRVLETDNVAGGTLSEVALFDTYPQSDDAGFDGVWSVYPYFPSGTLVVNDRENGLFVLSLDLPTAFATAAEFASEGDVVSLHGATAGSPASTTWVQASGTPAVIDDANALSTTVTLPILTASEWLSFDLIAGGGPQSSVDSVHIFVIADEDISAAPVILSRQ